MAEGLDNEAEQCGEVQNEIPLVRHTSSCLLVTPKRQTFLIIWSVHEFGARGEQLVHSRYS